MLKMKKILISLFLIAAISGCSCNNNQCKCPTDEANSEESYSVVKNDYSELYANTVKSVVMVRLQRKSDKVANGTTGSGVVVYEEGEYAYIYTNAHVVKNLNSELEIEVLFSNKNGFPSGESEIATLMGKDVYEDVAILQIKKSNKYSLPTLGDSSKVEAGDFVYTIGSPLGNYNYTTSGNVSAVNAPVILNYSNTATNTTVYALLIDAQINKGNSGGGLFNDKGELIGITSFKYADYNGLYGVLPINYFKKVATHLLINGTDYVRPRLNTPSLLSVNEMGSAKTSLYGIAESIKTGVYVKTEFEENLISDVIITEIKGQKITSLVDYEVELLKYSVGDQITITYVDLYGLNTQTVTITLHA